MDLLTAIQSEPLSKIKEIVLQRELPIDSTWLDYDALNRALAYKRKDVAKWLIEQHSCRVNKDSDCNQSMLEDTPLHNAVKLGDIEIVRMLLKNEASIVAVDSDNNTAFHISFWCQYAEITDLLLCHIVEKSNYTNKKNNQGLSHLHIACSRGNVKAIEGFLKAEANVQDAVKSDVSFSWAGYTALHFAVESRSLEAAKLLLAVHSSMKDDDFPYFRLENKYNHMTVLHMAFYNEYHMSDLDGTIVDYLYKAVKSREENEKDNIVDQNELSYFHIAVTRNDFVAVKSHLNNGANVNQAVLQNDHGFSGYTPLLFAVQYQQKNMAKFLIEQGANVNAEIAEASGKHETPLFKAFQMGSVSLIKLLLRSGAQLDTAADSVGNTLLHYAVEVGSHKTVKYLIDSHNYDVNCQNKLGQTPLILSLKVDAPCKDVVEILLNNGADLFIEDNYDNYAMAIANSPEWLIADMERIRIFTMFLKEESDLMHFHVLEEVDERVIELLLQTDVDLFTEYDNNETLVHRLARNPNPGVVEQLRGYDFDVEAPDNQGRTPLLVAAINGIANTVKFFLDAGADIEVTENIQHQTPLYLAVDCVGSTYVEQYKECVQILLERGANAQVEIHAHAHPTVLDAVLRNQYFVLGELVLAHLTFQEANGTAITQLIRYKIDSNERFQSYYKYCQEEISVLIYRSVTLFDVLTANEEKLERYLRNKVLASKLVAYQAVDYFETILSKRLPGALAMVELRRAAEPVVCELTRIDYNKYPCIGEEIVGYLEKQDLENLISM